jgi:hypothetical protein
MVHDGGRRRLRLNKGTCEWLLWQLQGQLRMLRDECCCFPTIDCTIAFHRRWRR